MRILFLTHFFPPRHIEGTENYTLGLARTMLSLGHEVIVVCAEDWHQGSDYWNGVSEDLYENIPVYRIHLNWLKAKDPNRILFDSPHVENWFDQFLEGKKPDLIHITSTYSLGVGVLRSAKRARIPSILTLMDFWYLCPRTVLQRSDKSLCDGITTPWECQKCLLAGSGTYGFLKGILPDKLHRIFWDRISKNPTLSRQRSARGLALNMEARKELLLQSLSLPDLILSHSKFIIDILKQAEIPYPIVHLRNGQDQNWLLNYRGKTESQVLRFGFVGQVSEHKGVHLLISAFLQAGLEQQATLSIWGESKDEHYSAWIHTLSKDSSAIFRKGRFNRDQLAEVFEQIDILVVPSIWYENAPLVIQEAFATRTPVITSNQGGMAEMVEHEVNGLLFDPENVTDLGCQMRRLIEQPELRMKLMQGIPSVKTTGDEVQELITIYTDVLRLQREQNAENSV